MRKTIRTYLFIIAILIVCAAQGGIAYASEKDFTISEDGTLLKYTGSDIVVTVPDAVKVIGKNAFENCSQINQIIIPEGVVKIGEGAFQGCTNLEHISFPSTLTTLEGWLFCYCDHLKTVSIPKSVMEWDISSMQFEGYEDKIERFEVDPENATFSSLDGVVYNKDMTVMLFYPNDKKEDTYTLPDSVTIISNWNFRGASDLKHLVLNTKVSAAKGSYYSISTGLLTSGLERITVPEGNETFCDIDGVLYLKDRKTLITYPEHKKGLVYQIPEGTERIWEGAFVSYGSLELRYILFPPTIKKIDPFVGYHLYEDDSPPNRELVFFGERNSVIETYARLNHIQFSTYPPESSKTQALLIPSNLSLNLSLNPSLYMENLWYINALRMPSGISESVLWKSSNPSIVAIDQEGQITGKQVGIAIISATAKDGRRASCQIAVKLPAPTDFRIIKSSPSEKEFTWSEVPGAKSYTIYRCLASSTLYKKLGTTTKFHYTDQKVTEGYQYRYAVKANHRYPQCNSDYSEPEYLDLPLIENVTLSGENGEVNINWSVKDFSEYFLIYRATEETSKYRKIAELDYQKDIFTDTKVEPGNTYYYKFQLRSSHNIQAVTIYSNYTKPISIKVE